MTRLPIRWQLTLAFGTAVAVVLAALGSFLYLRLGAALDQGLDHDLQARSDQIAALVRRVGPTALPAEPVGQLEADESFAQVLRADGTVLAASAYAGVGLLDARQRAAALAAPLMVERPGDGLIDESIRILATGMQTPDGPAIVLVSGSLDERAEALASLLRLELLGFAAALAASCVAGFLVAGQALRPVEDLRRRAADLSAAELARADPPSLPVRAANDELGRLGRTLNAMLARLHQARSTEHEAVARQRRFLLEASHQLRTPLAIIKGEAELALDTREEAALRDALGSIGEEADRLAALTTNLLALAAGETAPDSQRREEIRLGELLERVVTSRAVLVPSGRQILVTADRVVVVGDPLALRQLVENLVDNAVRHGAGDVELSALRLADGVRIRVHDRGPGFADEILAHPFERFHRAGPDAGAGLGLAVVARIAEAHGGRVSLGNDEGAWVAVDLEIDGARSSRLAAMPTAEPASSQTCQRNRSS